MTYHTKPAPRLSGSILYTLISVLSLTLITACGGAGLSLDLNISDPESRLLARCAANPFTEECHNPPIEITERSAEIIVNARKGFVTDCVKDATSVLCEIATEFTCEGETGETNERGNPFAPLCQTDANEATYESERISITAQCIDPSGPGLTSRFCVNAIEVTCVDDVGRTANPDLCEGYATDQTIVNTCDSDIFNSACDGNPIYTSQRNAFCGTPASASDSRCAAVILSACTYDANDANNEGNPFAAVCQTGTTYEASRNTIITTCTTDLRGRLCTNATTHACKINPFHALCYDASATVFQTARQTAVTNCGDGTTTITEQVCTDAVAETCEGASADIFNTLCSAYSGQAAQTTACGDNDDATRCYLQDQIDLCADGTEVARCASVGTGDISTCAADPFAAACVATASPFAAYLAGAQGARYDYCRADGVPATDPRCDSYRACQTALDGGTEVPAGCGDNFDATLRMTCETTPFDSQCTSELYDSNKVAFCSINTPASGGDPAVNNLFHANCTADYQDTTARNTFCLADPFHDGCKSNAAYADLREGLCTGDGVTPHAACVTPALGTAPVAPTEPAPIANNTARYADGFLSVTITADGPRAPVFAPITRRVVTPAVMDENGGVTTPETTITEEPTIGDLSINVGRRGGEGASDALNTNPDGYVFFKLVKQGTGDAALRTSQHAAILPTTNLGAPLTEAPATAVWPGHFSTTETSRQTPVDFYIDWNLKEIGFSNSAKTGIGFHANSRGRVETRPGIIVANQIRLSIKFNNAGQLYNSFAEIRDATSTPGRLAVIGFIGQEGVVAAFVDRDNAGGAGGFTASNPDHSTYVPAFVEADVNDAETDADGNASLVNYEDWVDSGAQPSAAPSAPSISEFLQTTTFTDKKRGFASFTSANAQIGDFNSGTNFRSLLLRGDAKNGFALHTTAGNHYSGVLHTADLGAPITQAQGSATWRGYLSAQYSVISQNAQGASVATTAVTHALFDLTVNFSTSHDGQVGELSGTVIRDINVASSGLLYTIDGRFNARGAISGTIVRTEGLVEAPLSGIIGQTGAIGVFASNVADNKFAGGFVAVPNPARNANYNDVWLATHKAGVYGLFDAPVRQNHWLEGGIAGSAGGVNGQSRAKITPGSLNNEANAGFIRLSDATWNRVALGGSAGNGVAFYSGVFSECTTTNGQETCIGSRQYYSGLFAQTDLGKPLTQTTGSLVWAGRLDVLQGDAQGQGIVGRRSGDIVLAVNFTNSGGTLTSVFAPSAITSPNYGYTINGNFNTDGFISGQVISRTGSYTATGYLSGLIGQRGAVAAIVGGNMAGGFVAHARAPDGFNVWGAVRPYRNETPVPGFNEARQRIGHSTTVSTYDDWAYYTGQRYGALRDKPHNESGQHNTFLHTNPADNHIPWGNIGQDGSREHTGRGAVGAGAAFQAIGLKAPAGLRGGFSWLAGFWDRQDAVAESLNTLNRGYHAGLFQDTNVGRPLGRSSRQSGSTTADWSGYFYAHQNKTFADSVNTSGRVTFLVNYGDNRRVTVKYTRETGTSIGGIYTIGDGGGFNWDERGIITGVLVHKDAHVPDANVTGLIGEQGMIAAFVSRADSGTKPHYGFTGGIIACPLTGDKSRCID